MEKVYLHLIDLLVFCGLIFAILKYWERKILKANFLETINSSYAVFMVGQIISILVIYLTVNDEQIIAYIYNFSPFDKKSGVFWSIYGIEILGFLLVYLISNLVAHLMFFSCFKLSKGIYKDIVENKIGTSILIISILISISLILSNSVLRPFIFDFITSNSPIKFFN
jgi:hypothetical protein